MEVQSGSLRPEALNEIVERVRQGLREELIDAGFTPTEGIELADRWEGGELVLRPGREGLQEKSVPIESFFRKIVMARERLRVLEQKINNHPKLSDPERLELQGYISRIYGSFTTFNLIFDNRTDWFRGAKGEK